MSFLAKKKSPNYFKYFVSYDFKQLNGRKNNHRNFGEKENIFLNQNKKVNHSHLSQISCPLSCLRDKEVTLKKTKNPKYFKKHVSRHSKAKVGKQSILKARNRNCPPRRSFHLNGSFLNSSSQIFDSKTSVFKKQQIPSTPKFHDKQLLAQNLTDCRLQLLFELQNIKKAFNQNFDTLKIEITQKIQIPKTRMIKCLNINQKLLQKEWFLIKKACFKIKNQKQMALIEEKLRNWWTKKNQISQLRKRIDQAFELIKL